MSREGWWEKLNRMAQLLSDEGAQGLAEYSLLLALVFLAIIISFTNLVNQIPSGVQPIAEQFSK